MIMSELATNRPERAIEESKLRHELCQRRIQIDSTGYGEDCNVVFLAKLRGCFRDSIRRLVANSLSAVKPVELARSVAGFNDAVGNKGEVLVGFKPERLLFVLGCCGKAKGQAGTETELCAVDVGG